MEQIAPDMKVAEVIRTRPETVDVFLEYGCPDMRGGFYAVMARLMSVRNAARIHRLPLDDLLADLNRAGADAAGETAAADGPEAVAPPPAVEAPSAGTQPDASGAPAAPKGAEPSSAEPGESEPKDPSSHA